MRVERILLFKIYHKILFLILFLGFYLPVNANDVLINSTHIKSNYVKGELLLKPSSYLPSSLSKLFINSSGDSIKKEWGDDGLMLIKLSKDDSVASAMVRYEATSAYENVQPNFRYYTTATANDTNFSQQWGLKNTGQTISSASTGINNPGISGYDIDAELAWDIQSDCSSVIVAVIDTGINYTHADLTDNKWVNSDEIAGNSIDDDNNGYVDDVNGYDFVDSDGDPFPTDGEYHGTHIAAIIGAKGDNNTGVTGVCKTAKIMSLRALGINGGTSSNIVAAVNYAVNNGAKVINMSLGGTSFDSSLNTAITSAKNSGVVVVVSAGNDGTDNTSNAVYPCNFTQDNLLCVTALDQSYSLASFSNFSSTHIDIGAPGVNTLSAWPGVQLSEDFSSGWTGLSAPWVKSTCTVSSITYDTLVNPSEQCGSPYGPYSNSQDDTLYKNYDLSSYLGATLDFFVRVRTADSNDVFSAAYKSAGGDPFSSGTALGSDLSGDQGTTWNQKTYDLSSCLSSTCTLGFKFVSDASGTGEGVSILAMNINTVQSGSTEYQVISGTSMASSHAAGVAALVYALNPNYTAADVVNALKNGAESISSLSGKTTTGNALNANNALIHIHAPTNVTSTIQ